MKRTTKQKGTILFPVKLLFIKVCIFALVGCTSVSKAPLLSQKLSFKIHWTYLDSSQKESRSLLSFVSLQERRFLRLDVVQSFIGVVGSFILREEVLIMQVPLKKEYYQGAFDSKVFFPEFPSFPSSWLIDILRGKASKNWECEKQKERITKCKNPLFKINWIYKNSQLYRVQLEDTMKRRIIAQIQKLSIGKFSEDIFYPLLTGWTKKEEPLFFQNF